MQEFDYEDNLIEESNAKEEASDTLEEVSEVDNDATPLESEEVKEDLSSDEANNQLAEEEIDTTVDDILASLDASIEKYNNAHAKEAEEKKVLNNRNLVLRLKKGQIDKVVNEANANITTLEKECFEKIGEHEAEIAKLEKEYLAYTNDIEKKAKAEVKKISDAILAPKIKDEEEAIDLISATDEELFERFAKEEEKIYNIRLDGINKIYEIKKEYYDSLVESERGYFLRRLELKREIELTKNKEDEEVANLRHIIKEETSRLRDEEYFTNHNAMLNLCAVNYKNKLYIEKLKEKAYEEVNNYYLENDKTEDEKLAHREWYLVKMTEVKNNKKMAKGEYLDAISDLNNEKNDYANTYTKSYLEEVNNFKKTMARIKKQPKIINDKYDNLLKEKTLKIENGYQNNLKRITKELETKTLMCKKN